MGGIGQVLNIAKEALLAHQQSVTVAGHNISNVDTPGYTRQSLTLTTNVASPDAIGYFGNGVRGIEINRHYDQFMVRRIASQNSLLSDLEAQQGAMRLVETSFNEAPGLSVNDLMSEFWATMQTLSTYPESQATRGSTIQQAQLLINQFHTMTNEISKTRTDINTNLDAAINEVNSLTSQIANLNSKIVSSESAGKQQNDLRDQRDMAVEQLAGLVSINYFEVNSGAYSIFLGDGHTLVENTDSWQVDWLDNSLQWTSVNAKGVSSNAKVGDGVEVGGKIGGWIEVHNQLIEGQPENYLGRLDSLANAIIREINQQHSQGVGLVSFSEQLTSTDAAANTVLLTSVVDQTKSTDTIQEGNITINGRAVGKIDGATATNGLAMAKTFNAANAINEAITGVRAKMTTQVSGSAITTGLSAGETVAFTVNGIDVSYTAAALETAAETATNVAAAITTAIQTYNAPPLHTGNVPPISIEAVVGDTTNGGAANSIILRNTNAGDESQIYIADIQTDSAQADYAAENKLGLVNETYTADAAHNTGQLSLFSHNSEINIVSGNDDRYLEQLGLGGGSISSTDVGGDGQLIYEFSDGGVKASLQGYDYSDELITDGGSFKIWLYNNDDTLALPRSVDISLERAYDLQDVADSINMSIMEASGETTSWVHATVTSDNKLQLTPDGDHKFAFTEDTSNFLATAGLNTFFTGSSSDSIGINDFLSDNTDFLAAGTVNTNGEIFRGDQSNVLLITNIQGNEYVRFTGGSPSTIDGFYNSLVGDIGIKGSTVERDLEYNILITDQMKQMKDSTSGVSLDEEMADLIKFQQAYSAAAKLISSSDEMLRTLLEAV